MNENKLGITDYQFVMSLYKTMFDKDCPDVEGVNYWLNDLANGATFEQVASNFMRNEQWAAEHSKVYTESLSGYIERNNDIINQAWNNRFDVDVPTSIANHTNILMFDGVPTASIMVMIAEAAVIGQNVEHPTWWGF